VTPSAELEAFTLGPLNLIENRAVFAARQAVLYAWANNDLSGDVVVKVIVGPLAKGDDAGTAVAD